MANRICGLIARRSRALLSGATLAVLTVAPGNVFAQGLLPVSWQFGSVISGRSVAYSPDGSSIAVGGWSGVQLYTAATQQPIRGFPTAISSVSSVCFSPDGKTLLVAGSGSAIEIWNVSDARLKASLVTGAANVNSAAFSPDGKTVAVGGATANLGVVELWNVSSQTAVASLSTTSKEIDAVAFSSDGKVLAVGGTVDVAAEGSTIRQGVLELWDPSAGTLTASLAVAPAGIDAVAISPDGKTLACGGEADSIPGEVVEIWSLTTDSLVASCTTQVGLVSSLAFSPDGETVADCGYYGESSQHSINWVGGVELWSAGGGLISRTPANDLPQMFGIAYSPDGQTLAGVGTNSTSGYVFPPLSTFTYGFLNTWDANTLRLQTQTYLGSSAPTYSPPVFSPDGKTVLAGGLNVSTGALNRWSAVGGNWMGEEEAKEWALTRSQTKTSCD